MFEFRPALTLLLFTLIGGLLPAQDDAETLIAMARKQEAEARGKSQEDRQICLEDALKTYRSVLTRFPADSAVCQRAWYEVGSLERRLGRIDAAREAYESALGKEGPDRIATRALDGLASIHRRQKSLEQAEGCLKRIVADYPSEPRAQAEARLDLMRLYRASKRFREAIQVGEEIIREHPSIWRVNVEAADLVCSVLTDRRRWAEAAQRLEAFDKMLEERYSESESWTSVEKALSRMRSRKNLTPLPIDEDGTTEARD